MEKIMQTRRLLPVFILAACGANGSDTGSVGGAPERNYATQLQATAPDYARIIASDPFPVPHTGGIEGSGDVPVGAKEVGELWLQRLQTLDVVDGYGMAGKDDDGPIIGFDLRMTAEDFDHWVEENGWEVPSYLRWGFVPPISFPRITEQAQEGVRIWPASEQRTGLQLQSADGGRVFLEDGCFYVQRRGEDAAQLAWFHAETGLDVDDDGYYVLVNRISGQVEGRLGENFTWASSNTIMPGGPSMAEFREACGEGEILGIANPTADAKMNTLYPQIAPDAMPPSGIE